MNSELGMDERQSTLIKAMRFPLIVLVVWSHALGFKREAITFDLSDWNVYHFVSEMVSHHIGKLAVCWFFVFSGYFFFRNLEEGAFSWSWVASKWRTRIRSLLIPFVLWNLLVVVMTLAKSKLYAITGIGDDGGIQWLRETGPLYWFWSGPADFPLWYMRDLILLTLLTPAIYFVFRNLKLRGGTAFMIILAVLIAVFRVNFLCFSFRPLVFFCLGALLGIWKVNMLSVCRKVEKPAAILAVVSLLIATYFNASESHELMLYVFYPFGMITLMNLCDRLTRSPKRCDQLCGLSGAVFFIYGAHEIFILGWTKGLFMRVFGDGLLGAWMSFLFGPLVVIAVCYVLWRVFSRLTPKTLALFCGGRVKK